MVFVDHVYLCCYFLTRHLTPLDHALDHDINEGQIADISANGTEQLRKLGKISTLCNYPDKFNQYWSLHTPMMYNQTASQYKPHERVILLPTSQLGNISY